MQQELSGLFLLILIIILVLLGLILRRQSRLGDSKPSIGRDARLVPNEDPARSAVKKPEPVRQFDAVNVHRPTMLALTTARAHAAAPEVFIQRAFKIDREHWLEVESSPETRRKFDALFAHVCQLAWVPGSAFERHIYSVSFAPELEEALKEGIFRPGTSAGAVTHVKAIDENGETLGEPMKMSLEGSQFGLVASLWAAFNPKGISLELRSELDKENAELARRLAQLPNHVAYETVAGWTMRYSSLSAVVVAIKVGLSEDQVEDYLKEIDGILKDMRAQADGIDEAVSARAKSVFSLEDADDALVHAIAYMYVRDLTVRVMRICLLLRVAIGNSFEDEVRCANAVAGDVNQFTDVRVLIAAAHKVAHDKLDLSSVRTAGAHEIARAAAIGKHAEELEKLHDEFVADLKREARKVQQDIDQALLRHARMHCFAVRVSDDGQVEKLFVLNA